MYNYYMGNFYEWFEIEYQKWSRKHGNKSENQFAKMLGISQATVNAWMQRTRGVPRSKEIIDKLAVGLGPEVYDVLDLRRPGLDEMAPDIPPEFRALLVAATRELADTLAENKIDPASPEGEALAVSVMEKHGFKRIATTSPGKSG